MILLSHYNVPLLLNVLKINVDNEVFGFLKAFHICALHCQIWRQELLSFPLSFFVQIINGLSTPYLSYMTLNLSNISRIFSFHITKKFCSAGLFCIGELSLPLIFILAVLCTFRNLYEHHLSHNWVKSYNHSRNSSRTLPP